MITVFSFGEPDEFAWQATNAIPVAYNQANTTKNDFFIKMMFKR